MSAEAVFSAKAPIVMGWLMRDFEHLQDFHAAGILGNTGVECLGFTVLREFGQPPGRGGYGWQQWTGPRAHAPGQFLDWCQQHGLDWRSDEGNYGFMKHELQGAYSSCIASLLKTNEVNAATLSFERTYERAGVPAIVERQRWARLALSAYRAAKSRPA